MNKTNNILLCLIVLTGTLLHAEIISIGGADINLPTPEGYGLVTEDMPAMYTISNQLGDSDRELIAYYINAEDIPAAKKNELPGLDRVFILTINKKLVNATLDAKEFNRQKNDIKKNNLQSIKELEKQLGEQQTKMDEIDPEFALQVSGLVPYDAHYETDRSMAWSMFVNYGFNNENTSSYEEDVVSITTTILNIQGKALYMYCYGTKDDLEWTREASKNWTKEVLTLNDTIDTAPTVSANEKASRQKRKGTLWIIGGLIIAAGFFIYGRRKK
jgi:hypothetical protein